MIHETVLYSLCVCVFQVKIVKGNSFRKVTSGPLVYSSRASALHKSNTKDHQFRKGHVKLAIYRIILLLVFFLIQV